LTLRHSIARILDEAVKTALSRGDLPDGDVPGIKVEYPREEKFGDYATPFAMEAAKTLRQNPMKTGEALAAILEGNELIENVEVVRPGFVNLFINRKHLCEILERVRQDGDTWGRSDTENPWKINLEFVSANPTGPMNVVSARAAALGDSLANLLEAAGHQVEREYYVNDYGNQVRLLGLSVDARIEELQTGSCDFPEEGYQGEYVIDIARHILDIHSTDLEGLEGEDRIDFLARKAVEYNVESQKRDLEAFNVSFDRWFSERSLHEKGAVTETLAMLKKKDVTYESEGKTFFRSGDFGDDKDRVIVRDDGRPTYLMADIAYHNNKAARGYDRIYNIWGPDHHGYIDRLSAAMEIMGYGRDRFQIIIAQQVNLVMEGETVKMSKRLGNFSTMRDLVGEIGKDVARYFFIMRSKESHLDFDLALAKKESSENPVFYLQYAHARISSLFREAEKKGLEAAGGPVLEKYLLHEEGLALLKLIARFPEEVEDAAQALEPMRLSTFLMRLAQSFHKFYTEHRILCDDPEEAAANLALCQGTATVMRNGLRLLGVSAPERM
jgi:arginyl-tRNA synthetase